jgi:hypothetical protein
MLIVGNGFTITVELVLLHPDAVEVKVNVVLPTATPVTTPRLETVATVTSLLNQVPPEVGDRVIVLPTQTEAEAETTGRLFTITDDVEPLHPDAVSVNVKVTLPLEIPVTRPALVTVAFVMSLLNQDPPEVGDKVIVLPTQTEDAAETIGAALTVTDDVVLLQPVAIEVNVKLTVPAAIPVTTPALFTVALVGSLLTQVPPVVGERVIVLPTQTEDTAVTVGGPLTVTDEVVLLQPVTEELKVNVTDPEATPVTKPALVTVAFVISLLNQVPPEVGESVMVFPIQTDAAAETIGAALMVTAEVVLLQTEEVGVKVNVALPEAIPLTRPVLSTVALVGSLLVQVPPVVGLKVIVPPIQTDAGAETIGAEFIVTIEVVLLQPVAEEVKVNVALPEATPVTTPKLLIVAFVISLLVQVPPVIGDKVMLLPTQTDAPAETIGNAFIITSEVELLQPVATSVKVNITEPAAIPEMTPALVAVAFVGSLLVHVPPVVGESVAVEPTQRAEGEVTTGNARMSTISDTGVPGQLLLVSITCT